MWLGHAGRGAITASLFRLAVVGGRRRLGKPGSLGSAGRKVRIKRFRCSSWSPAWFFGLDLAEFAFAIRIPVLPAGLGPEGRLSLKRAVLGLLQAGSRRFDRGRFGGRSRRLVGVVVLITQSLAKTARHFGSIAAAANGPVRALSISVRALSISVRALPVTIRALPVSASVLGAWWSRKRGGKHLVGRFGS